MKPDGDQPGATGYMNSGAGTSLPSGPAARRAAGLGLPQEPRSPRDLATGAVGCEHEHAGHDFDQNKLGGIGSSGNDFIDEWRQGLIELLRSPARQLSIRRDTIVPASRKVFD